MLTKRTYFSSLILVSLVALTSWFSIGKEEIADESEQIYIKAKAIKIELSQMDAEGHLKYRSRAESATQYSNGPIDLAHPFLELHDPRSTTPWKLQSEQATVVDAHQKITLSDHVVISRDYIVNSDDHTESAPSMRLFTEHLTLYPNQNYAETTDPVTIEIPDTGTQMLSNGMKVYLRPERLELISHIRSTYDQQN
jgi:LPS export ABC transporter protein LptC